jgi:hypothetical protein
MAIVDNNPFYKNNRFLLGKFQQYPEDLEQINCNGEFKISYQSISL